ncbi:MAG: hypothetical protein LUC93_16765 [Planctomycetaceae bacterium]|nr:hypothetical protein [Planctomycetaceae bacterium]
MTIPLSRKLAISREHRRIRNELAAYVLRHHLPSDSEFIILADRYSGMVDNPQIIQRVVVGYSETEQASQAELLAWARRYEPLQSISQDPPPNQIIPTSLTLPPWILYKLKYDSMQLVPENIEIEYAIPEIAIDDVGHLAIDYFSRESEVCLSRWKKINPANPSREEMDDLLATIEVFRDYFSMVVTKEYPATGVLLDALALLHAAWN